MKNEEYKMGKIFGISDLPVSTPMTPFEQIIVPENPHKKDLEEAIHKAKKIGEQPDRFVLPPTKQKSKSIIDMKFGFGKLMKHFSKKV